MTRAILCCCAMAAMAAEPPALRRVDISALDQAGRPVRDLRAEEIDLRDSGARRPLVFFRHWSGDAAPHVMTVVLDLLEWWPDSDAANAWDETVAALRKFEAAEDLYFYVLTKPAGALIPVRPLPESEAAASAPDHHWVDRLVPQVASLRNGLRPPLAWDKQGAFDNPIEASFLAADTIAAKMARLSGRKALVWIGEERLLPRARDWSGSYSVSTERMAAKVRRLEGVMNRGDIALYAVRPAVSIVGVTRAQVPRLAHVTGGRDRGMGDIAAVMAEAVADTGEGYRAFYVQPPPKPLEDYREVRTRTTRSHVKLLAQTGYNLDPDDDAAEVRHRLLMDRAAAALRDSIDIPVRASLAPSGHEAPLTIDANALLLRENAGQFTGTLLVQFVTYGVAEDRKEATAQPVRVDLKFSPADRDRVLREGLRLPLRVALDPDARRLRVIVCDLGTEMAGSITFDLPRRPQ